MKTVLSVYVHSFIEHFLVSIYPTVHWFRGVHEKGKLSVHFLSIYPLRTQSAERMLFRKPAVAEGTVFKKHVHGF